MRTIGETLTKYSSDADVGCTKKLHRSDENGAAF